MSLKPMILSLMHGKEELGLLELISMEKAFKISQYLKLNMKSVVITTSRNISAQITFMDQD